MLDCFKKKTVWMGAVLFRGSLPPRPDEFDHLQKSGIAVKSLSVNGEPWPLLLQHKQWGTAKMVPIDDATDHKIIIQWDTRLCSDEQEAILAADSGVHILIKGTRDHVLRDRKNALRFAHAIMGQEGIAVVDHMAQTVWSREALEDELMHDADLDVDGLFSIHFVSDEEERTWAHTHGLAELGFFDFDIMNPSSDLFENAADAFRAIAFAILEKRATPTTPRLALSQPGGAVRFAKAEEYDRLCSDADRGLRMDADDGHCTKRAVLCEPAGGIFGRWSRRLKPSSFLSGEIDGVVFFFSYEATELMAERARHTYTLLRQKANELEEFDFPVLVKLGYRIDGDDPDSQEHLWFNVEAFHDDAIDATLINEPFGIARMKAGQRDIHSIDKLTDWSILTPAGTVSPRSTVAIRRMRPHFDELREVCGKDAS